MILKDIFESSKTTEYEEVLKNLREKYGKGEFKSLYLADFCDGDYSRVSGYAKVTYSGKLKDDVELTALELSMICDDGYSHFGGRSNIYDDKKFTVMIYTD